jgi:hypothetical protein
MFYSLGFLMSPPHSGHFYLDLGNGSIILQLLIGTISIIGITILSWARTKNLFIIGGVAIVFISCWFLPVMSFTQQASWTNGTEFVSLDERSGTFIGIAILLLMFLKWKWRGVLWIVLGVIGAVWTPTSANTLYDVGKQLGVALDPNYIRGGPSYEIGLFLIVIGYLVVIGGGIWDILQKNKQEPVPQISTASVQNVEQPKEEKLSQEFNKATEKLEKLKDMLDKGLISKQDYEAKKADILSQM